MCSMCLKNSKFINTHPLRQLSLYLVPSAVQEIMNFFSPQSDALSGAEVSQRPQRKLAIN